MHTTRLAHDASLDAVRRPLLRDIGAAMEADDVRRFDYTEGWDDDDAALGWVDADAVRRAPRLH
ncbi:hypothetical protein [Lysobacter humi (ex Lee et al. 2017)]